MKSNTQLTTKDLLVACQNAKAEGVNSLVIQHNGVNLPVVNAVIVPQRNHSDLTLFVGATINKDEQRGFIASLFGKKAKSPPLHKQITPAVIATINQIVGSKISTNTLNEIKTALSEVNEHFETVDNNLNPLGFNDDLVGGAL